jgi:hypothetical protein
VLGPSKKVLVNPRGVSQIVANTFFQHGHITKMFSYGWLRLR